MIFTAFFSVGQQVLILFVLIAVGFICAKAGLIKAESISSINNILMYTVTSAVIIDSFHREFNPDMLFLLGLTVLAAVVVHLLNMIATVLVRDKDTSRESVLRFSTVLSNCGFMATPLQRALLGSEGVFYCSAFIVVFAIFMWTYGIYSMGGKEAGFSPRKIFLNPGIIAIIIGLFFFLTPFSLPNVILMPVRYLAAMNTPLPMLVIGFYLSRFTSLKVLRDGKVWFVTFLRLVALPLIGILLLYAAGLRGTVFVSLAISASSPVAATALVFSGKFNRDTELAATLVSISTIVSIVTMPLLVALAMVMT